MRHSCCHFKTSATNLTSPQLVCCGFGEILKVSQKISQNFVNILPAFRAIFLLSKINREIACTMLSDIFIFVNILKLQFLPKF